MSTKRSPTSSKTKTSVVTFCNAKQPAKVKTQKSKGRSCFLLLIFACCLLLFLCSGCGKVGNPLPPIPRAPLTVDSLTATQQGDKVMLSFPLVRTPRSILPRRVDVYRLIETASDPLGVTEEAFSSRSNVIASIPATQLAIGTSTISYEDQIDFKTLAAQPRYRYAVRMVNQDERPADLSNYALLEPLIEIAEPPTALQTTLSQTELEIRWTPPAANLSGKQPASIAGYNLYRRAGQAVIKLNSKPLTEPRYLDRTFQFDTACEYFVRALSLRADSKSADAALESNASAPVALTPKDTFAPAAPNSITIASVNRIVSLFWPANAEPDVAGYNLYRSEVEQAAPDKWTRLNPQLHKPTSFRDNRVQVGKQYFYQLTAVDNNGNESTRSVSVSEIVNP